jgi:hypothetical protein
MTILIDIVTAEKNPTEKMRSECEIIIMRAKNGGIGKEVFGRFEILRTRRNTELALFPEEWVQIFGIICATTHNNNTVGHEIGISLLKHIC